jgi:hypothetical protein
MKKSTIITGIAETMRTQKFEFEQMRPSQTTIFQKMNQIWVSAVLGKNTNTAKVRTEWLQQV